MVKKFFKKAFSSANKVASGESPKEAPDTGRSKQLVKIVEVISEGEIEGFENGENSIFFDNTPLLNEDGSYNFSNTAWQARAGEPYQPILNGFTTTEKEVSVSTEVKKAQPITRTVTDGKVHRIRLTLGVSSLFHQNDNGDTNGTQVDFKITVGNRVRGLSINGKYSSQYLRNIVIDNLPVVPFQIKVERVQEDSTTQRLQNKTIWASYTEIIDNQFTYPNTALIGIKFDSEYFASIPTRTYDIKGIKVQVPSNYNPVTRAYSGLWDGSFQIAWTDNPAWILYDIVTNKRYGLGKRLGDFGADKWALYQVAQYCDKLVPDGFGNTEPRFTCNVWLTEQRSAYDVINDICSIFRAMPVWNGTTLTVIQDRPADPVWTYTNANVIGGFSRQYSAMKARHNAIQVEYKDKDNNYETTIEYVSDDEAIRKYGLNLKKVQAFGCTSRGQAYRTGKWILETERLETETITFTVGTEGLMHLPGDIIRVADSHYAGTEIGGRVLAVNGRNVTLDREIQINGTSHLSFINDNAQHSHIRISSVRGNVVTLASNPTGLEKLGVWSLTTEQITARLYRAMSIAENDDGSYTITALQHEPQKEAIVDNGASFEPRANTLHQVPKIEHLDVAVYAGNAGISWQTGSGSQIVSYDVKILKDGKLYALHKGLKTTELDLSDLPNGDYQIIIISRNASGQIIDEKSKTFTIDRPPAPKDVQVFGGLGDVMISWQQPDDFTETEIWASETDNIRSAKRVARVMANIYSHTVGAKQIRYYWVRHARGQNLGPFYQEAGLKGETGADIDKELALLNEKLKEPLSREILETALPARQLEMVKTVSRLENPTTYQGAKLIFNQHDGKLYRWDGKTYTAEVKTVDLVGQVPAVKLENIPSSKITGTLGINQIPAVPTSKLSGQLSDAQIQSISAGKLTGTIDLSKIPAVPTSKLSGQVSAAQISANSIGANHIATNAVSAEKIQANAVNADKIATNAITAVKIAAGAVNTDKLAANAVSAAKIQANAIGANHIAANAITAGKIAANAVVANSLATNAVTADKIHANAVTAVKIATNAVTADKVAANAITAGKIAANAVTAGTIQAGAINANHIASAAISTDKLAVGLGGNLLYNPIFSNNAEGWITSNGTFTGANILRQTVGRGTADFTFKDAMSNEFLHKTTFQANYTTLKTGEWADAVRVVMPVARGQWYMFSAYFKCYRCAGRILVEEYSADGKSYVKNIGVGEYNGNINGRDSTGSFQHGIAWAKRHFVKFQAPETGWIAIMFRISEWLGNNPDVYIARPMLEECHKDAKAPSPWQNAGVTSIHGGSIKTNTITAQQIAANTITGNEIVAGTIATKHLAANSVTATQLAANSVTANKMNVTSLSAISSNIGTVTAGTIKGTTIMGNTISGGTISGTTVSGSTISGGTIKGAKLEAVTGRFTGELEVTQLIGGNVFEITSSKMKLVKTENKARSYDTGKRDRHDMVIYGTSFYAEYTFQINIRIASAPVDRYIESSGNFSQILKANTEFNKTVTKIVEGDRNKVPSLDIVVSAYAVSTNKYISFA